jgi:hypothetical protein
MKNLYNFSLINGMSEFLKIEPISFTDLSDPILLQALASRRWPEHKQRRMLEEDARLVQDLLRTHLPDAAMS